MRIKITYIDGQIYFYEECNKVMTGVAALEFNCLKNTHVVIPYKSIKKSEEFLLEGDFGFVE